MMDARKITLQRRHGPSCSAGQKKGSYTFESDERRRGAKPCRCPIYACGTLNGVYKRSPTGRRVWTDAQAVLDPFLAAGSWDVTGAPATPPPLPEPEPVRGKPDDPAPETRTTIEEAIEACYTEHKAAHSAETTVKGYRTVLDELTLMCKNLGFRWLDEWKKTDTKKLRNSWTCSARTARKKMSYLKAFFQIFVDDETLEFNPARIKLRATRANRERTQKSPFTDQELQWMLEGCRKMHSAKSKVVAIRKKGCTGNDLADFIEISSYTGLRISDVVSFHIDRLTPDGEVKVRCLKNGNWVCVWIPEWLRTIIQTRAKIVGPYIFGNAYAIQPACAKWRRRLRTLWKRIDGWTARPTHHRFRHTFVRRLLEQGVSVAIVAQLIGDTEQMVRNSYSDWIKSRQEAMSQVLQQAFANAPRYHR